jgi:hypothetical protein
MRPDAKLIRRWLETGANPTADEFYANFVGADKLFTVEEGQNWDFKDAWPFSLSDEYFGGIARLICAFGNSGGGIIVFGVHDKKRTGGHNPVNINLDRFTLALEQLIEKPIEIYLNQYTSDEFGSVDALFVPPRRNGMSPYRFKKQIGKYKPGVFWIRVGNEVLSASPKHFPILFCRQEYLSDEDIPSIEGSLPPSPATLKRFVGRAEVLCSLFEWLEASDEPRTYLHGKGGSGKTTIAYEFARLIKEQGNKLKIQNEHPIDAVIYVSAKEKELVPLTGDIAEITTVDFSNESELIVSLLTYGNWTSDTAALKAMSIDDLRRELTSFLDITSCVIIIDDIDTLTTKNVDAGSDYLYRVLCRSKRYSKVLYTLRNAPTQSLVNSVEVPGLHGEDYQNFVANCVTQFNVPTPEAGFLSKTLPEISERRPLVIESVIALVRTTGSYSRAAELFSQQAGENIRDYVFRREWEALRGSLSKLLLAALSEFRTPATFSDLQTVLQVDQSRVRDAITEVREMFLQVDDAGHEARYALAPLTTSFVKSKRQELVGYGPLRERAKTYQRTALISNPRVAKLVSEIDRLLPRRVGENYEDAVRQALRMVTDGTLPPNVTEDPLFKCALGYVYVSLSQPRLLEAREAFAYATQMRHEPEFRYLNAWFYSERQSGTHSDWTMRIADIVLEGRRYSEAEKVTMISLKATSLYARGRDRIITDPVDGLKDFEEALKLHLRAFKLHCLSGDYRVEKSEQFARNTAYQIFQAISRGSSPWEIFDTIGVLSSLPEIYLDPLENPIVDTMNQLVRMPHRAETMNRLRNKAKSVVENLSDRNRWLAGDVQTRTKQAVHEAELTFSKKPT